MQFNPDFQIAVMAVMSSNKSGSVLVLEKPGSFESGDIESEIPERYEYSIVAVPNPFNPETEIRFSLKDPCKVKIDIYDIRGRLVRELKNESLDAGSHSVKWNGRDNSGSGVASGVYMAQLVSAQFTMTTRMVLVQ